MYYICVYLAHKSAKCTGKCIYIYIIIIYHIMDDMGLVDRNKKSEKCHVESLRSINTP